MHCYCVERHHPGLLCFDFFDGCRWVAMFSIEPVDGYEFCGCSSPVALLQCSGDAPAHLVRLSSWCFLRRYPHCSHFYLVLWQWKSALKWILVDDSSCWSGVDGGFVFLRDLGLVVRGCRESACGGSITSVPQIVALKLQRTRGGLWITSSSLGGM